MEKLFYFGDDDLGQAVSDILYRPHFMILRRFRNKPLTLKRFITLLIKIWRAYMVINKYTEKPLHNKLCLHVTI